MRRYWRLGPRHDGGGIPNWAIPMVYVTVVSVFAFVLPRIERSYLASLTIDVSLSSAVTFFSTVASGVMALTAMVFTIAFVMVQFSTVAYSPRLVAMFVEDPRLYHTLGVFFATFTYALSAIMWTDRGGSGTVPLFSTMAVAMLTVASMLAFARLIHTLSDLQIQNVLHTIGAVGREVIHSMYRPITGEAELVVEAGGAPAALGQADQILVHAGGPRVVTDLEIPALVGLAESADGVVVLDCAVGDTVFDGTTLLRVHGARARIREAALLKAIHLGGGRTYEQDPKYPLRLLVDIAIRALSPAVNDPTTAVQALDQIEDLLRRLGRLDLDIGKVRDAHGRLRVVIPVPTWQDYLSLAFDEIRHYGTSSIQVLRRLRSALVALEGSVAADARRQDTRRYLSHLDLEVDSSDFDAQDRVLALQQDRQGLGMAREQAPASTATGPAIAPPH